ncbi:alanine racemase [Campylobacter sp. RM12637]|uniref:alanine racemase n=1 Tax=Campylobacter sp. RM12637 TaxID=2735734 RepID=UPI00301508F9|nr:alanine racemase [Campylobacter sp. RM12637]
MAFITINKANYFYNLNECLKKVSSIDKLIIILKDNAYGHDINIISDLALEFGIKNVAVKNINEASIIQNKFKNILILSQIPKHYKACDNYILAINDLSYFDYLNNEDKVALKLDTNMHRSGICENNLELALKIIKEKKLKLVSAFTHYSSPNNIKNQKPLYIKMCEFIKNNYSDEVFFHSANSSTLFLDENEYDKAARVGLAQFGYCDVKANLKPVLSLWAEKISSRIISAGDSIGYDEIFVSNKDLKIANYDLGYGDGLLYYKGLKEFKLANNEQVLGKISMDSFSIEDTNKENICVFNDALKYANYFNTNVYEALVRLNPSIKKIII